MSARQAAVLELLARWPTAYTPVRVQPGHPAQAQAFVTRCQAVYYAQHREGWEPSA